MLVVRIVSGEKKVTKPGRRVHPIIIIIIVMSSITPVIVCHGRHRARTASSRANFPMKREIFISRNRVANFAFNSDKFERSTFL